MAPRKSKEDPTPDAAGQAEEAPLVRVFALRPDLVTEHLGESGDPEPVTRVAVGCAPRVSLGPGETFETSDPHLAEQLANTPELVETTA